MLVIAPNKNSIYPEYMPGWVKLVSKQTRLDQLSGLLADEPGLEYVDGRLLLRPQKNTGPLYYRTDTHWTPLGAFYGLSTFNEKAAKVFSPDHRQIAQGL